MKYLDLTLPTPAENLACDEALLDWCETGGCAQGLLRFWEPAEYFVVVGYGNRSASDVNLPACRQMQVPVLRRCSGGGTVLQGPACLNYSLLLKIEEQTQGITETNRFVMSRNAAALVPLDERPISVQGFTDLTVGNLKFSGNSQRRKRQWLLFHGTFLIDVDLDLMEMVLLPPEKQPPYRQNRSHSDFLTRFPVPAKTIKAALQGAWGALEPLERWPSESVGNYIAKCQLA
jgi:lipoate-protein ligase A